MPPLPAGGCLPATSLRALSSQTFARRQLSANKEEDNGSGANDGDGDGGDEAEEQGSGVAGQGSAG